MNHRLRWVLPALMTTSAILALWAPRTWAQWQWTDEHGRPVFSDLPPPKDIPPERIIQRPDLSVRGKAPQASADAQLGSGEHKLPAAVQSAIDAASVTPASSASTSSNPKPNASKAQCDQARAALARLSQNAPLPHVNAQGQRGMMNAEQRTAQMGVLQDFLSKNCK